MGITEKDKKRLAEALLETPGCVKRGDFTLRSGAKSDFYINLRKAMTLPNSAYAVVTRLAAAVSDDWPNIRTLGAPGMGGALILGAMMPTLRIGRPWHAFVVREVAKGHGNDADRVAGHLPEGADVILLDDVLTSGSSLLDAVDVVRKHKCQAVAAYVVVDRQEGGRENLLQLANIPCYSLLTKTELFSYMDTAPDDQKQQPIVAGKA